MDTNVIFENSNNIQANTETKKALLNIIDTKINNDMKEVINEIHKNEIKLDSFKNEVNSFKNEVSSKFNMLTWLIGILMALMIALKFIK